MIYKNRKRSEGDKSFDEEHRRGVPKTVSTAPFPRFRVTDFIAAPLLSLGFFFLLSHFLTRMNVNLSPLFFFVFEFGPYIFYTFKFLSSNYEQVRFATPFFCYLPIWLFIVYRLQYQWTKLSNFELFYHYELFYENSYITVYTVPRFFYNSFS